MQRSPKRGDERTDFFPQSGETSDAQPSAARHALRITSAPAFANNWLSHRIADFQTKNPTIDLEIDASPRVVDLATGDADIGIRGTTRADIALWSGHHSLKLFSDELFPVCSPEYLRDKELKTPADLAKATLLRNPTIPWKPWFQSAGLHWDEPTVGPTFRDVTTLLDSASSGAGVALAGRIGTLPAIRSGRLVRLFDVAALSRLEYFAVCLPTMLARPEVVLFLDWLVSEAKEDVFKGAETRLQQGTDLKAIVRNLAAAAVHIDDTRVTLNDAAEEITGYTKSEIRNVRDWFGKLYVHHSEEQRHAYAEEPLARSRIMRGSTVIRKDGQERSFEYSSFPHSTGEVWLINDVTERRAAERRMQQLAFYDHLTSLPNRLMFTEQLRRALARAARQERRVGVFFIDLDGFKQVNDQLGHEAGDRVLKEIARRLISCVRQEDTAARFGGDEFAILLDEIEDRRTLALLADRVLSQVSQPISLGAELRSVGASIGISSYPENGKDLAQLMRYADLAMYEAKTRGKNCYCFASDLIKEEPVARK